MATQPVTATPEVPKKRGRRTKDIAPATAVISQPLSEVKSEELVVRPANPLALAAAPDTVLEDAVRAAKALTNVIDQAPESVVMIRGKRYLRYEHWATIARFYGVTAKETMSTYVEHGGVKGYEASADVLLVATNQAIGHADSQCMSDEPEWSRKPLFQMRSMAQTRACAKALRSVLSWVVVLAGFNPTPAEEIIAEENAAQQEDPNPRSNGNAVVWSLSERHKQLLGGLLESINTSRNMNELQDRYRTAYRMAHKENNAIVLDQIGLAKDKMKEKFANVAN